MESIGGGKGTVKNEAASDRSIVKSEYMGWEGGLGWLGWASASQQQMGHTRSLSNLPAAKPRWAPSSACTFRYEVANVECRALKLAAERTWCSNRRCERRHTKRGEK